MLNKKYLLFDLDGTIIASDPGITRSVQYALHELGIDVDDLSQLKPFVGPPLRVAFPQYYGLSAEDTEKAVELYRSRYEKLGIMECDLYSGMDDLLKQCALSGYTLVLATSKPGIYARKILERFHIDNCFTHVVGCELDGTLDSKAEIIEYAIKLCGDSDREKYIMIGDRFYDADGAKAASVECIGVLYGYGSRAELENAGAEYIVETVSELNKLLLDS